MTPIEGWTPKALTDLAEYINGYAFKPDDWGQEGLPIVRIEQLKNPGAPTDHFAGPLPPSNIIKDGDLVFSWSASLFLRIWRHGVAALNQHLFKVIERENVDRAFLKAFIEFHLPALVAASHGSTMQHITRKELRRFSAPFPDAKTEQVAIASVLSQIEQAIDETDAVIAKSERIKKGLLHDLLTRGINKQGNLRTEEADSFKNSNIGRVPVEWQVGTLAAKAHPSRAHLRTGPFGSALKSEHWVEVGVPVITIGALGEGSFIASELLYISPETEVRLAAYAVIEGDIVFSRVADVGRSAVVTAEQNGWIMSSNLMRISVDTALVNPKFLQLCIAHDFRVRAQIRQLVNAGGRDLANSAIMNSLEFVWPPKEEQDAIVSEVSVMDAQVNTCLLNREKLLSIKRGLMDDLLRGNRRVASVQKQVSKHERRYG